MNTGRPCYNPTARLDGWLTVTLAWAARASIFVSIRAIIILRLRRKFRTPRRSGFVVIRQLPPLPVTRPAYVVSDLIEVPELHETVLAFFVVPVATVAHRIAPL